MTKLKNYWPIIEKIERGIIKPKDYIPSKLMYNTPEKIAAYNRMIKGKNYFLTKDSELCLSQNKKYLAELLKDYTIIELGGFDGSALNNTFRYGQKKKYEFDYINVDIGRGLKSRMRNDFKKLNNIKFKLIRQDFDKIRFVKKIKTKKPKAVIFLQNTFNNYNLKDGDEWLRTLNESLDESEIAIIGFDKRVSAEKHLVCYRDKNAAKILWLTAKEFGLPTDKIKICIIFDKKGIRMGIKIKKEFRLKDKNYKTGDFIEICLSLKLSAKQMTERAKKCGFKVEKIIKSNHKHSYHMILRKLKPRYEKNI